MIIRFTIKEKALETKANKLAVLKKTNEKIIAEVVLSKEEMKKKIKRFFEVGEMLILVKEVIK